MSLQSLSSDLSLDAAIDLLRFRQGQDPEAPERLSALPGRRRTSAPAGNGPDVLLDSNPPRPATCPSAPSLASMASRPGPLSPLSPKSPLRLEALLPKQVIMDEPIPDRLVDMLRRAADFEQQSLERSTSSRRSRFTQSCQSFRTRTSVASSRLSRAVSLRQQTNRVLATRVRQSPGSPKNGKNRFGQMARTTSDVFRLPEIPGAGDKEQGVDASKVAPKGAAKPKSRLKKRRDSGPQDVSIEAAQAFWNLTTATEARQEKQKRSGARHGSTGAKDTSDGTADRYRGSPSGPGVPELSRRLGMPQQVAKEAAQLFQRFADIPRNGGIFDGKLKIAQLEKVLVALCDVGDVSELSSDFTERAFKAADRDTGGFIDLEEFAVWYSSFCFAEEVTVKPQVRQTRELARQMGLEIWAIEKFRVAFDKYDADGSGEIEFDEFSDMVQELLKIPSGHELPYDRLMTMWRSADMQQKGFLDFKEFCFFYVRMVSMEEGCDPIRDYYRNVRSVPVAPM
ncbi:unnamed protein product [Effrenium voratum]|nr:unnamed protein product [Effrenium voratum]